ncbi:hypothetical protein CY34DRAFT_17509 [Suillus luteus UH-Slu-Lm8-n1]|uniref:Uncharacterized protein n=1 Tax=Suillus luteus UH-Slu-Lm8-n1 TaxID=930992 RepID=A0A0D0A9A0_9AGAM|nr:hypothetical protein CY34DRAFT_17509 [Suillus luteus UH-Slu-Lm8-n1]
MLVHTFDQTHADIAHFVVQHPGNFRFTTSIESDTLTLSFHSSLPPSNDFANNNNIPSPAYSPINWDELSGELDNLGPSVDQTPSPGAVSESQQPLLDTNAFLKDCSSSTAHSSAGGGHFVETEVGEFSFDSESLHNLTGTLSIPTLPLGMDDDLLPIICLLPNGLLAMDTYSDALPNAPSHHDTLDPPNTTLGLGHIYSSTTYSALHPTMFLTFMRLFTQTYHLALISTMFLMFTCLFTLTHHSALIPPMFPTFTRLFTPTHHSALISPMFQTFTHLFHFNNVSYTHAAFRSTASFGSPFVNQPYTLVTCMSDEPPASLKTNDLFVQASPTSAISFSSPYTDYTATHLSHSSNPSFGLPNGDHPYAAASHMANSSFVFANSMSSMDLGNDDVPPMANTMSPIYIPEHTATLPTCDTCNVLSAFNEPYIDSDSTSVHDMDPGSLTDSMIPHIDALLDVDRIRDSVKEEAEFEEGEIWETDELTDDTFNGVTGGPIYFSIIYKALNTLQSRAALDEQTTHIEGTRSPTEHSTDSSTTEPAHPYIVTPPNSERRLSPIIEEYMPSLVPSRPFSPEPDIHNIKCHLPTPPPMMGAFPYHGIIHLDGWTQISFDGLTQHDVKAHLTMEHARYNDYHSVYIPNVVHAIDSFNFCQDGLIALDWDMAQFQDGTYGGHPVIPGLHVIPTSPFYAESFENPFYFKRWYSVSDIFEDPVEEPKTKGKKFFL